MDFVNGKDDNTYMKWNIKNVPHHQPVDIICLRYLSICVFWGIHQTFFLPKILPVFYVGKTMSFLPPMTGNGKHTTYKMVKLGMVYYRFTNITVYYIMWLKQ